MQQESQSARRYAKSLLDYAIEQNELAAVAADMDLISNTCQSHRELRRMLKSPIIKAEKKLTIIQKIFSGEIGTISLSFLELIAAKQREAILPEIANAFIKAYRTYLGIVTAEITSTLPLAETERTKAVEFVKKMGKKVELIEKIDENIIGGFIIRIGDKQYDASVVNRIKTIRTTFLNTHSK